MSVALIAWARLTDAHGNKITVPAPSTDKDAPWLWDFIAEQSHELASKGFTHIQAPPASKAQGGAGVGCDGYGVYCRRDLGDLPQQGSTPTRYGTAEALRRAIAMTHANGMSFLLDVVMHQFIGENGGPGVFKYLGADHKTLNGRGQTAPGWFRGGTGSNDPIPPFCKEDDVPSVFFDFPFGRELSYQNCNPHRVTIDDATEYGDWLFRTTDADGMRFDDVKGTWAPFVSEFLNSGTVKNKWAYSEYFEGNPATLNWWVSSAPMNDRSSVEDFTLHWALQNSCNNGTAHKLNGAGYTSWNAWKSVTFVDNPDTDSSPGQQVISNKLLAYAFILTIEGFPFVYGKDYYSSDVWPGAYGLKQWIDNLVWIHENLAHGDTTTQYADDKVIVLNRTGSPGLLTGLNFDTWNKRTVKVNTSFGPNCHLHDYSGHGPDVWTDSNGHATISIPSNAFNNGQSYVCYSRAGLGKEIPLDRRSSTMEFFGSYDLPIPPALNGAQALTQIWVEAGRPIESSFTVETDNWTSSSGINFLITDASGAHVNNAVFTIRNKTISTGGQATMTGWHTLGLISLGLPDIGSPWVWKVTYTAPQTITKEQI